ncbi:hypothetical protein B0T25DRAFT_210032 [Lasiosphaeria hispida]|uniref:Uncharacterized protein n=1 Tax=Lasiosphaeria hispida TaxID=260671 RepID=A0AAJ0MEE5_9PEZI|nr:hypothetical protein B0T25DRAFT_210032 [Lasiosphaeria hispida]
MDPNQKVTVTVQANPVAPPPYIKSASRFSPAQRQCCQCQQTSSEPQTQSQQQQRCGHASCDHDLCRDCHRLDGRGGAVIPHSFPAAWVCSTCTSAHSVLDILTRRVACDCEAPSLQAVYDQFGRIFLYWRDDPAVYDLTDPAKVQEAAWRVWEAGAEPWLADVVEAERRVLEEEEKKKRGVVGRGWRSSVSSEDSLDVEMAAIECQ